MYKSINKINIQITTLLLFCFGILNAQDYQVERKISKVVKQIGEINSIEYIVLNDQKILYSVNIKLDYDLPFPELKVFGDGSSILINSFDASLTFFDNRGSEILVSNIFKKIDVKYERSILAAVSENFIALTLSQPELEYSIVQIYNNKGEKINEWPIAEKNINGLAFSASDQILAISTYHWDKGELKRITGFYDISGFSIVNAPLNFNQGRFINKGTEFLGYTNKDCFIYNIDDEKIIFIRNISEDKMILAADIFNSEIIIAAAEEPYLENGQWYYKNPYFISNNLNKKIVKEWHDEFEPFKNYRLIIKDSKMFFETENKIIQITDK